MRAFLRHQCFCKTDCRIDIAWMLLQIIPQSPLLSILTDGAQNALARSRIDLVGAEQLWG
ncbi:hypothetical protein SJ05684_a40550 (plasmid) [Sinorhizobium sojae CCBAU 05684]|uniref:Uncharacterized protein n=1 Tax=Sinorhizobium sojae CCBAU 05684 TaxID=716928 RepID=A0A249PN65_9HYPH|nr:hypothetical protein SJ05684_a40550 [Sinorhizobium sojae CCBAU 05684]ASY74045.1 hypothetical protein SF83666_a44570 [Sinorhizobium fredii CCBAU 83666]AWI62075.1 hypothetical protein AB395_00004551 [Sinorhizobium fredii CCBAU 45436]AWM30008.1 hypothetical protein AOX55_00004574 [Sinorhizobium fredii CCBAU 25509]